MKRDELRASLEAKGIIMPDWPEVPNEDSVLVVDECGCCEELIEAIQGTREAQAADAAETWADKVYVDGGLSGFKYPDNEKVYAIFHDGEVLEASVSTDWEPSFTATIKAD